MNCAAAESLHLQRKTELLRNPGGVLGKDSESSHAHVPQPNDPDIHLPHARIIITMRGLMKPLRLHLLLLLLSLPVAHLPAQKPAEGPPRLPDGRSQTEEILKA